MYKSSIDAVVGAINKDIHILLFTPYFYLLVFFPFSSQVLNGRFQMANKFLIFLTLCSLVLSAPSPIVPRAPDGDLGDPSSSDPKDPPKSISFPKDRPPNPYPSGVPIQPQNCDGQNPSNDCFTAMSGSGGYLYFDKDSQCSDSEKSALQTAVWDATTLASYASKFPNVGEGNRGQQSGRFYMGPDFASQQNRISGNLERAWQFKTDKTSEKEYITVSCKDTKNLCGRKIDGKAVGGYAWTYSGWVYYYHYITLCPAFFSLDTLDKKLNDVEQELGSGSKRMATDMTWLRSTGQFFLHEMMHTRIASGNEPHIIDEYVAKIPDGEKPGTNDVKAYGPRLVHNLAKRALDQGGGATRASTNADSYAILANAIW
jgi:hypothetical protein